MVDRQTIVDDISNRPDVSVLIVGGGINGAGLLRELALQGVDALLVDKADFCSGASAASSRMVHGGLRYLEFGEFRLVAESLKDRNLLLRNARHYVHPLRTTIPIFRRFSGIFGAIRKFLHLGSGKRPTSRGSLIVKMGLTFYDILTRKNRVMPKHKFTSRAKSLAARPMLPKDIVCTATYYDAWVSYPERLGLELILDANAICPEAQALNYVSLQGADGETVLLRDELSGGTLRIKPKIVVNATGAWIDFTNRIIDLETTLIGGTKGAHLVIDNDQLFEALAGGMIYYETPEGRVAVALPWLGKSLIGSTDIRVDNPDDVRCTDDEVDYMLESIGQVLPDLEIDRSQILSRFSGVRPLRYSDKSATVQVSRDHLCAVNEPDANISFPVYSMTGGKWTTFRAFAEQVTDTLLERLGLERRLASGDVEIGGGRGYPEDDAAMRRWTSSLVERMGLDKDRVETLLQRYGTRGEPVAIFTTEAPDELLKHHPTYTRREIEFIIRHERIVHIDDILLRRTAIALLGELTEDLLGELVEIAAGVCDWPADRVDSEIDRARAILFDRFGINMQAG
ncbi:MAG: glycerol-3-phosphate dehydrogenase/oxidase [Phycisphaerae bacterium]|jgi:glycerol-3-phosphate dehydrogenase|nr:glycerol-3-phosphate dehydrogenase/oxidase [Phycisphaerae bacterium]